MSFVHASNKEPRVTVCCQKGTLNEDELRRLFGANANVDTILRQFGQEKVSKL